MRKRRTKKRIRIEHSTTTRMETEDDASMEYNKQNEYRGGWTPRRMETEEDALMEYTKKD